MTQNKTVININSDHKMKEYPFVLRVTYEKSAVDLDGIHAISVMISKWEREMKEQGIDGKPCTYSFANGKWYFKTEDDMIQFKLIHGGTVIVENS